MSLSHSPHVTIIITAYDPDRFTDINQGINSILNGKYKNFDIIVTVDGRQQLADRLEERWEDKPTVTVICNDENVGAAKSRNIAVRQASGDIVAFFDDDAVADENWLRELVQCYTDYDAVAVGGKMEPIWLAGKPKFLPDEFYWLIGVTYTGFPDEMVEVRNTFASNLSIRKSAFKDIGGFNPEIGPKGESLLQSAETDLCGRLAAETGHGVLYNPDAKVGHKIYEFRTDPIFLFKRAFWQGVSKRGMQVYSDANLKSETNFLKQILFLSIPNRAKEIIIGNRIEGLKQIVFLILATTLVGFGYLYGFYRFR